jgi:hypothetical protein
MSVTPGNGSSATKSATPAANNTLRKHMTANTEQRMSRAGMDVVWMYPSELQPLLRELLATLTEIDFEHESDIETVRTSSVDEWLKQTVIGKLQERRRKRRAPYVAKLERLQRRTGAMAA